MKEHYLYRHIRKDLNQVFYVGVGTKPKNYTQHEREYSRAFVTIKRSEFWKNIVNKTEYEVEILLESNDYEFIKTKEKEFIKLYGRKDLGLGTLVNLTDGGDGNLGYIPTKETVERLRKANTGRLASKETKLKQSIARKGIKYSEERRDIQRACMLKGENHPGSRLLLSTQTGIFYDTIKSASKAYNIKSNHLSSMLLGLVRNKTDLIYADEGNDIYPIIPEIKPYNWYSKTQEERDIVSERFKGKWVGGKSPKAKKVINILTGILYDCVKDAAEASGFTYANFKAKLNPNNNRTNNTPFEYYDEEKHKHLIKQ